MLCFLLRQSILGNFGIFGSGNQTETARGNQAELGFWGFLLILYLTLTQNQFSEHLYASLPHFERWRLENTVNYWCKFAKLANGVRVVRVAWLKSTAWRQKRAGSPSALGEPAAYTTIAQPPLYLVGSKDP